MPDTKTTRVRDLPYQGGATKSTSGITQIPSVENTKSYDCVGTQITVSEGNQVGLLGKTGLDIGSDFFTKSTRVVKAGSEVSKLVSDTYPEYYFKGLCCAVIPGKSVYPPDLSSSDEKLRALGTKAIAICSPVNSHAELLTSVGEAVREGLPSLPGASTWRDRTHLAKGAGSEYLGYQFGWVPLVSEIRNLTKAAKKASDIIHQLERDNGRNVRRTFDFQDEKTSSVISDTGYTSNGGFVWAPSGFSSAFYKDGIYPGRLVHTRVVRRKTWFSGCFTYYLPTGSSNMAAFQRGLAKYDVLYGVAPTPDVLWNLAPWSWAVDWFANIGDVIENASNALLYSQVLRYGYVMETTTVTDTYTLESPNFKGGSRFITSLETITKKRVKASPYGFGLTWDGFNTYQLSILAALGISRR